MNELNARRKRRRRPTFTPRFGPGSVALEIGLLRMMIEQQKDLLEKKEDKGQGSK